MRIHLLSDLHLDHSKQDNEFAPSLPACDLRLVLGDICEFRHRDTLGSQVLRRLSSGDAPVAVVLGNHDHYHRQAGGASREARVDGWRTACNAAGARLLDCEAMDVAGIRVLGCTWWSAIDWLEAGPHAYREKYESDKAYARHVAELGISDFRCIKGWSVADHQARHAVESAWLAQELESAAQRGSLCLVATHFLPHRAAIDPAYAGSALNAYFTNHRPDLVRQARAWMFGHTHRHVDVVAEGVRLVANPRGYPSEKSGFVADFVVEV